MKVNDVYTMIKMDGEREQPRLVNAQMDMCLREIEADVQKVYELQRQIFYKRQQFNMMFKEIGSREFNIMCSLWRLFELHNEKNLFYDRDKKDNKKEFDEIIQAFVGNFFPQWMWDKLEFSDFYQENYGSTALSFFFTWKYGKKKTAEWEITVPNPMIIMQSIFDPCDKKCVSEAMFGPDWKTNVTVVKDYNKEDRCLNSSEWVGSAWMNSDVRDIIDAKAKELEKGVMKKEDESHAVRS